jgi:hypothetical protein
VSVKMTVFWGFAPCSLVEVKQRFKGDITVMMEPVTTFEMLVHFYETIQCNIPEETVIN